MEGWHGRCYSDWHVMVEYPQDSPWERRTTVDTLLIIGIVLLLIALLGVGGVIGALGKLAYVLLIIAVIIIAWRVITGRRPV